jgi:hypothetical protein
MILQYDRKDYCISTFFHISAQKSFFYIDVYVHSAPTVLWYALDLYKHSAVTQRVV